MITVLYLALVFFLVFANGFAGYFALSVLASNFLMMTRGDAPRFARPLPLAIIFRAFGAGRP